MSQRREVVITGSGVVSPIGIGNQAFWDALHAGRSGVRPLSSLQATEVPVRFGAPVTGFEPKQYVRPRKSLKVMCREIQTGFSAARMAMDDARLEEGAVDADRFGVVFASEMFYCDIDEIAPVYRGCMIDDSFHYSHWGECAMRDLYPLWMLMYLPNMVACHIGISNDARGPNNTIAVGEASSLLAVIEGASVIQRNQADVIIVGGTGTRLNITPMMFRGDANLSHRVDDPQAASRPFDALRDGMVNGEGAAALILEARDHAEARGAPMRGRVLGWGSSFEPCLDGPAPQGLGIKNSIQMALRSSGIVAADIGHVNAHGISTPADDAREAQAIFQLLGDVPVTAPKSLFGNLGTGGGAVELVASLLSFETGEVPATRNYEHPDPECPVNVIRDQPLATERHCALALNQSGTGQAAAVVLAGP